MNRSSIEMIIIALFPAAENQSIILKLNKRSGYQESSFQLNYIKLYQFLFRLNFKIPPIKDEEI